MKYMHERNMGMMIEQRMDARLPDLEFLGEPATLFLYSGLETELTTSTTADPIANPEEGDGGREATVPTESPKEEQTAMLSPTPNLRTNGLTDKKTRQPVGEETPADIEVDVDSTLVPTDERTESLSSTPGIAQIPTETQGGLGGIWGWIGAITLIGVILFLAARLILKNTTASDARHKTQRADQGEESGMSADGKQGMKPVCAKEAAYSPTVVTVASAKTGSNMQNVNRLSTAQSSSYRVGYAQTIGKRPNQEDSYGASTSDVQIQEKGLLAVVADGIGGMEDGQIASSAVVRTMFSGYSEQSKKMTLADRLLRLATSAQSSVLSINHSASLHCGSTVVSILADGDQLSFLSIGDSRIYLYRGGALLQLNREHKFGPVHDENVALGYTSDCIDARRRAAITSYIGRENMTQIDRNTQPLKLMHGDKILLMTDGVFESLCADELVACLGVEAQLAAEQVIAAVERKSIPHQDNATVVIVEYP